MAKRKDNFDERLDEWLEKWLYAPAPTSADHLSSDAQRLLHAFAFASLLSSRNSWLMSEALEQLNYTQVENHDTARNIILWLRHKIIVPSVNTSNGFHLNLDRESLARLAVVHAKENWGTDKVKWAFVENFNSPLWWRMLVEIALASRPTIGEFTILDGILETATQPGSTGATKATEIFNKHLSSPDSRRLDSGVVGQLRTRYLSDLSTVIPINSKGTRQSSAADGQAIREFISTCCSAGIIDKILGVLRWKLKLPEDKGERARRLVKYARNRKDRRGFVLLCRALAAYCWEHERLPRQVTAMPKPLNTVDKHRVQGLIRKNLEGVQTETRMHKIYVMTNWKSEDMIWSGSNESVAAGLIYNWDKIPIAINQPELPCHLGLFLKYISIQDATPPEHRNYAQEVITRYSLLAQ